MAAKRKSASRRSAAKAKGKKAGRRPAAKKSAAKKVVGKRKPVRKKAAVRRKPAPPPKGPSPALAEIDQRIALVRNNLRDLSEQAASTSGSASEEALSDRITSQEAELQRLRQERDALAKREGG